MSHQTRAAALLLAASLLAALLAGCANNATTPSDASQVEANESVTESSESSQATEEPVEDDAAVETVELIDYADDLELVPLAESPALSTTLMPVASGTNVYGNSKAEIDASNTADGYVMIRYLAGGTAGIKVIITGPTGVKYTYNLRSDGQYETFPLSDGNGSYKIAVYRNVEGTKYATEYSTTVTVTLKDEFAPFLLPNQYVNYTPDSQTVKKAAELTANCKDELSSIRAVYEYVVNNLTYDKQLAETVQSGYLPNLDQVLARKQGICFDYAALMTAMLRSQGIPCKLVVGYSGTVYHAWINAYAKEQGWISNAIYFDGTSWKLMDPTFASTGKSSPEIMKYIGDGANYAAKYLY